MDHTWSRLRLSALRLLSAALFLGSPIAALRADNGDVLIVSSVLEGKELTDITFDSSADPQGGSFWAVTRFDGRIYHLSSSLDAVLGDIPNPHGVGSIPNFVLTWGVAYRPGQDTLFVLARASGKWKIREASTADGTEVGQVFDVTPPDPADASLKGLAFESETQALWFFDVQNETVFSTDLMGAIRAQFQVPSPAGAGVVLRGEGLCLELERLDSGSVAPRLYVSYGDIFWKRPTRAIQVDLSGQPTGIEVPLTNLPFAAQGIQTQRIGFERRLVAVSLDGKIAAVEHQIPAPIPPSQLVCSVTRSNKVDLAWRNNGKGSSGSYGGTILVLRNGVPFAALAGTESHFVDASPMEGRSVYSLRASESQDGPFSPPSFPCEITVGAGGVVRWVPFAGSSLYDLTADPVRGEVFATDPVGTGGSGRIFRYDSSLQLLGEIPSPFERPGGIAFVPEIQYESAEPGGPSVVIRDALAVAQTNGSLLSIIDLEGNIKTTFPVETGSSDGKIGGLTYVPPTQEFAFIERTSSKIVTVNKYGRLVGSCKPPDIFFLPAMNMGLTYDAIRGTYLATFVDGYARELFTGLCARGEFDVSLEATGEGYQETGGAGGVQIYSNTLFVARSDTNAIFQVLVFPFTPDFIRGDFDRNAQVNLTDAIRTAEYLFRAGPAPECQDAADANDDGVLDISDPVYLLFFLFLQGPPPPAPYPGPGIDPTFRDNLGCES